MSMDPVAPVASRWSLPVRIGFRFSFAYLVLLGPGMLSLLPYIGEWVSETWSWPWERLARWVGDACFGVDATSRPTGSGDTWAAYVHEVCSLVLAAIATAVWSVIDRRRLAYPRLFDALRSLVRLVLGMTMLSYGLAKVSWTQFVFPDGETLMRPYGESTPMGILWNFMGYSFGYCLFTGLVECAGGLLLWWRRTTMLGALLVAAAMANVFVLNLCYDVPVKLLSLQLLLMAVWLLLPELRRLVDFFILHRPVAPRPLRAELGRRWLERARRPVKLVVLGWISYRLISDQIDIYNQYGGGAPRSPLQEIYQVERHAIDGVARPPLATDGTRWKRLTLDAFGGASVTYMDDRREAYAWAVDEEAGTITLTSFQDPPTPATVLRYTRPDPDHLELAADLGGQRHTWNVRVVPRSSFLLVSRGFHWHQEYPFNQ